MPALSCLELSVEERKELSLIVWQVLSHGVEYGELKLPDEISAPVLKQQAASFVTLYVSAQLKGCIGCYQAKRPLWQDVCKNAYSSAFQDYRFDSLSEEDLAELTIDISILSDLSPINNCGEQSLLDLLVPELDGLLLKDSYSSAIFLPSVWKSLKTASAFVTALKEKAGWASDYWSNDMEIYCFNVQMYRLNKC